MYLKYDYNKSWKVIHLSVSFFIFINQCCGLATTNASREEKTRYSPPLLIDVLFMLINSETKYTEIKSHKLISYEVSYHIESVKTISI